MSISMCRPLDLLLFCDHVAGVLLFICVSGVGEFCKKGVPSATPDTKVDRGWNGFATVVSNYRRGMGMLRI